MLPSLTPSQFLCCIQNSDPLLPAMFYFITVIIRNRPILCEHDVKRLLIEPCYLDSICMHKSSSGKLLISVF